MIECKFKIKDLASIKYYNVHKQDARWWLFNEEGEGVEIEMDALYSMVDNYFKENS